MTQRRASKGESYWDQNNFPITNIDREISKILTNKIPVHTFTLGYAGPSFQNISSVTGGRSAPFDLNSPNAAEIFASFIVENILKIIGDKDGKGGDVLIQAYKKMYK